MVTYFHNPQKKTLYKAPSDPQVTEQKDRRGDTKTWKISALVEEFCFDGADGNMPRRDSYVARDFYDSRDSRDQAVSYFKQNNYPQGEAITMDGFHYLYEKYTAELNQNGRAG